MKRANGLVYLLLALAALGLAFWGQQHWSNYAIRLLSYAGLCRYPCDTIN